LRAEKELQMKNVIITIKSCQTLSDSDEDCLELITGGQYSADSGNVMFCYEESELTGFEGTKTVFTIEPGTVVMSREGALSSKMVFQEGKKHTFVYETPHGSMTMGVDTHMILSCLDVDGGELEIHYAIDMNNASISKNSFKISMKTAQGS
jgi:uncharacterized beta-barrel protein YwiB (DUF1934 family)